MQATHQQNEPVQELTFMETIKLSEAQKRRRNEDDDNQARTTPNRRPWKCNDKQLQQESKASNPTNQTKEAEGRRTPKAIQKEVKGRQKPHGNRR